MSALDTLVISAYAALILWVGTRGGRGRQSWEDLVLARRGMPAGAVLGSTLATELSAATFIGVPHAAYTGDWAFLQLAVGALAAKALLAWRVIPLYHRLGVVTVYDFLESRFGFHARRVAATCFVLGRVLASGARLFIAALAFAAVAEIPIEIAIVGCGLVAGIYTRSGGIRAVIWTDILQAVIFLIAALGLIYVLISRVGGGFEEIWSWAQAAERTRVVHFDPSLALADARSFWVAVWGGFFLTLATHATDYDMVQRLLTARDGRRASAALLASAVLNFPLTVLFLFMGTALAFFYTTAPAHGSPDPSQALATFAWYELPSGLRGLLFTGLMAAAMSSLDSAICAIATTWVVDVRPGPEERRVARLRWASAGVCGLLMAAAIGMAAYHRALLQSAGAIEGAPQSLVELALSAMTLLYGGLLGVFAVGLSGSARGSDASAVSGLLVGAMTGLLLFLHPILLGKTIVAWPWWIPMGAAVSLAVTAAARGRTENPFS